MRQGNALYPTPFNLEFEKAMTDLKQVQGVEILGLNNTTN